MMGSCENLKIISLVEALYYSFIYFSSIFLVVVLKHDRVMKVSFITELIWELVSNLVPRVFSALGMKLTGPRN